jgi:hypothetical protein
MFMAPAATITDNLATRFRATTTPSDNPGNQAELDFLSQSTGYNTPKLESFTAACAPEVSTNPSSVEFVGLQDAESTQVCAVLGIGTQYACTSY